MAAGSPASQGSFASMTVAPARRSMLLAVGRPVELDMCESTTVCLAGCRGGGGVGRVFVVV